METCHMRLALLGVALVLFCVGVDSTAAFANGEVVETEYSTGVSEATGVVRIIVAVLGGVIAVLGVVVTLRGIGGKADVSVSLSEHRRVQFKRVGQGVVVTILGVMVLIAAIYFLPEKRTERKISGKEITIEGTGDDQRIQAGD